MLQAEQFAIALIESGSEQWYVTGLACDVQKLYDAGVLSRSWDIKLDNGHRPYAVLKKRVNFKMDSQDKPTVNNSLTAAVSSKLQLSFTGNLYDVTKTYLLRRSPAFWSELNIAFAEDDGTVKGIDPSDFYAVYQGVILHTINGVKFSRMEREAISKTIFPALS